MDIYSAGGRPEGFAPVAEIKSRLIAEPKPGWNGIVNCEVLEVHELRLLRYSWADGNGGGNVTQVTYRLEPHGGGTGFTYEHTGFTGVSGLFMARLLGRVRAKMLHEGLPSSWTALPMTPPSLEPRPERPTIRAQRHPERP